MFYYQHSASRRLVPNTLYILITTPPSTTKTNTNTLPTYLPIYQPTPSQPFSTHEQWSAERTSQRNTNNGEPEWRSGGECIYKSLTERLIQLLRDERHLGVLEAATAKIHF
ncbi:hypothetical protein E2C01_050589 [Portunus trituberculatus]|uniref:Uncharacterized protein n=1 Tax=Portunus trituberculatus TaxID=210409 RepID=A0A5B7GJF0_PORTR|nr:hypothetical protein [Portunus trituberculatus]